MLSGLEGAAYDSVAPHAGAWIEIGHAVKQRAARHGRPPRGGVD